MKRDLDLIRKLLIFFDDKVGPEHVEVPPIDGYDELTIKYHLVLLHDAELLRCEPVVSSSSDRVIYVLPFELTWAGHDFLDNIRTPQIWKDVMAQLSENGLSSASIDIVNGLATAAIHKQLGK
jgi:hypothetical protein